MRLRLSKVDELQFLTCLKHQVWGSHTNRFKDWRVGDYFIVIVDKALAGLAEVAGETFISNERIWVKGLFPCRIPIQFNHALLPHNRPMVVDEVRNALVSSWGINYGLAILSHALLTDDSTRVVSNAILARHNDIEEIQINLEHYLSEAKQQRETLEKSKRRRPFGSRVSR